LIEFPISFSLVLKNQSWDIVFSIDLKATSVSECSLEIIQILRKEDIFSYLHNIEGICLLDKHICSKEQIKQDYNKIPRE